VDTEDFESVEPVAAPSYQGRLTNQQILLGKRLDPLEVIKIYSEDDWEQFIREWVEGLKDHYVDVRRASGAGDKGRDVIGYVQAMNTGGPWDNYQCKHYGHALHPGDLWKELAKLCYYTFIKKYSVPRAYYFVAPRGVGPECLRLLENPEELRVGLIAKWGEGGLLKVGKDEIVLDDALRAYVDAFDFSIIKDVSPSRIIEEHRKTRHYAPRFGGGLVRLPPREADVPEEIAEGESRFVGQLLEAYGDHLSKSLSGVADLKDHPTLKKHFDRQRTHFYLAELLRNFTRDNIPEDGCYERLQDAIYDGVVEIAESEHNDGFERVKKTIQVARSLQIDSHPLKECLEGYHRSGVCHQLANTDRLTWVP
jgi:hypothetical protein